MGQEILEVVEESRYNQNSFPSLNSTFIALISKTLQSEDPKGFCLISLSNVIYKIIVNLIVKWINPLLLTLISPEQIGFVEGRKILDRFITSQEFVHSVKAKKLPGMMIKLVLSKAYDRHSWDYLSNILKAYGFSQRWINWILAMISSLFIYILLNKTPTSTFNPTRGLIQGDPISPFLFIIDAEGMGHYIKNDVIESSLRGLRIWSNDLAITHQQFVDDIMLFYQVSLREAHQIKEILSTFMEDSGTKINNDKYCIFFFHTQDNIKTHLAMILGFSTGNIPFKYLSMPLVDNPLKLSYW